jgi:hypothetical protein
LYYSAIVGPLLEFAKAHPLVSSASHLRIWLLDTPRPGTAAHRALGAFAIITSFPMSEFITEKQPFDSQSEQAMPEPVPLA